MAVLTAHRFIIENLTFQRGSFNLHIPRLEINEGEKIAILGENGCGKTTLLQLLCGILNGEGRIIFQTEQGEKNWNKMSPKEKSEYLSYLPQQGELLFNLTVAELLELRLKDSGCLGPKAAEQLLINLDLKDFTGRFYHELSGGEKRRAMLARVLCRNSVFTLLDEPTAPMDLRHTWQVMNYLAGLPNTVMGAVHDINTALKYFNRFLFMKEGRLYFDICRQEIDENILEQIYSIPMHRCGDHFVLAV